MTQQGFGKRGLAVNAPKAPAAPAVKSDFTGGKPASDRDVNFGEAIALGFVNYFNFTGRSSRGAYWWWTLFVVVLGFAAGLLDAAVYGADGKAIISNGVSAATFLPGMALVVRRLHDVNKSGWWFLIVFTIIGAFWLLWWYCQPGDRATNDYGEDLEAGRD